MIPKRLTNKNLIIKNTNYNDLPLIKFKDRQFKIPLLKDLTYLKNSMKIFNLEIKEKFNISDIAKNNLFNLIKQIKSPVIISSFNWKWYEWCVDNNLNFAHLIEDYNLPENGEFWIIDYQILNENIITKIKQKTLKLMLYSQKIKKILIIIMMLKYGIIISLINIKYINFNIWKTIIES